MIFWK